MAPPVKGTFIIQNTSGDIDQITLNGDNGDIRAGGNGEVGDLILLYSSNAEAIRLGRIKEFGGDPQSPAPVVIADYVGMRIKDTTGRSIVQVGRPGTGVPTDTEVIIGAAESSGTLVLKDKDDRIRFVIGQDVGQDGRLVVFDGGGRRVLEFNPEVAALYIGSQGNEGDLILRASTGDETVKLDGGARSLRLGTADQPQIRLHQGNAWLGGNGYEGDLYLYRSNGNNTTSSQSTFHASGGLGRLDMGGNGTNGLLRMRASNGNERIRLDAGGGNLWLGGNGADGDIVIFAHDGDNETVEDATIHLNGNAGDIVLRNADCAEEFDIADDCEALPGAVMVFDETGVLRPCGIPYDRRVAGVVSGAGSHRPGIVLDRRNSVRKRAPVALVGKVFCQVRAGADRIAPGDLLTTSELAGHAMKATDRDRAFGAVFGKALGRLDGGTGMIPVLVALQ